MQIKLCQSLLVAITLAVATPSIAATTLRIATVSNPDMERMQGLSAAFTSANPDIKFEWIVLDENTLRQRVTTDIATSTGRFDIVTIGSYEAPIWAERGWLSALDKMPEGYDVDDLLPTIREGLSFNGKLYAAPFYGESSFTMYRTDLFDEAGLEMPAAPTWDFIRKAASAISKKRSDTYGVCLRGKPGWGENVALITAMANSYGARWFDNEWRPQFDSEAWAGAVSEYVSLIKDFGPPDAVSNGYSETLQLFKHGKCAIWIDATVAASSITDPKESSVAGSVGFALAPDKGREKGSNWLWAWALAISSGSEHQEAARRFVAWATSRQYAELVAAREGWVNAPPGTRKSLYQNPAYLEAAPFATMVLASIEAADPEHPTVDEVPYTGIQYVAIPEFPGMATAVGAQIAKAAAGKISPSEALKNAQWVTGKVIKRARFLKE
ncbi:sugar ABC transporter substrate-binding protein [Pseudomaricurvus alcaniphilus]|uniref:ABC transporter substrate-binding protein n=1 Tax=Pseudomaricurvus alcaniphilus TaxID=1166482 RepID=UPI00140AE774|nr:sugar ABC transporter substrate-binding protein [Pseudomaricurvus alcaniphilus]NHN38636.1 sugar ABC transporter substrate-binding protein [Pseudomaricurvus alcaniphilus]